MLFIHLINRLIENLAWRHTRYGDDTGEQASESSSPAPRAVVPECTQQETGSSEPLPLLPAAWEEGQSSCASGWPRNLTLACTFGK